MIIRDIINEFAAVIGNDRRFDLERLAAHELEMSRARLLASLGDKIDLDQASKLRQVFMALAEGEPLQYLLGSTWFMNREFLVNKQVLIPRFDTEILVNAVLDKGKDAEKILDLCTGSGIIAISLKSERPEWTVFASDLSKEALLIAKKNAGRLRADISLAQGDLFEPWEGQRFDVIVSNPPYVSQEAYEFLAPDVKCEPTLALIAEDEGLAFYKKITAQASTFLNPGGQLFVEIGYDQAEEVKKLFDEERFSGVTCLKDEQGLDRVVYGKLIS